MSDSWIGLIGALIGTFLGFFLNKLDELLKKGKLNFKTEDVKIKTLVSNGSGGFRSPNIEDGDVGKIVSAYCFFFIEFLNDSQFEKKLIRNFNVINNFQGEFSGCYIDENRVESIILEPLSVIRVKVKVNVKEYMNFGFENNYLKLEFENQKFKKTSIKKYLKTQDFNTPTERW